MKGFAPSLDVMQQYRVCLAPLRFGAGLKGKIVDSWAHGTPVCTTPIGAEGMFPATSHSAEGFPDLQVQALCFVSYKLLIRLLCLLQDSLCIMESSALLNTVVIKRQDSAGLNQLLFCQK